MDLTPYVESLQDQLLAAAEAGGGEARELAEYLIAPLEPATRLALFEALSAAADEITRDLAPGSVEVRLRGREPEFAVTPPPPERPGDRGDELPSPGLGATAAGAGAGVAATGAGGGPALDEPAEGDDGGTARITLRLPTHLKPRIDEAANRAGLSANAWLVRVVAAALQPGDRGRGGPATDRGSGFDTGFGQRYRGWVR